MTSLALVTPTYWRDLELCTILCESVDRYVTGFSTHYLVVADDELPLFAKLSGERRRVLPISQLLPPWLKALPRFFRRHNRRWWLSLRTKPVSGWHTQQFIKIAAACTLPEQRFCMLDSDVVFFRPCNLAPFAQPHPTPLLHAPQAVQADTPMHAQWIRSSHRLLGFPEPAFPADDFIGHIIVWDQLAVRAMTDRIEHTSGMEWIEALCRAREISEYMLYGYFIRSDPALMAGHRLATNELCLSYWEGKALDDRSIEDLLLHAAESQVAFSAASFSGTPVPVIRAALTRFGAARLQVA